MNKLFLASATQKVSHCADKEIYENAGRASGMGLDGIGETDRATEGLAAG